MDLVTIVVAYNRPLATRRLLHSIFLAQDRTGEEGKVILSVDGGSSDVMATASEFKGRDIEVITHERRLGLREHVLKCGDLSLTYGKVMVLEDDLILSPAAYHFTSAVLPRIQSQANVKSLSLYSFHFNEFGRLPLSIAECQGDVFYARTGSSWGQVWWANAWAEFREWLSTEYRSIRNKYRIPQIVDRWPDSSWKRLYNCFLADNGYFTAVPRVSFALNSGTRGTHHRSVANIAFSPVRVLPGHYDIRPLDETARLDEFLEYELSEDLLVRTDRGYIELRSLEFDYYGTKRKKDLIRRYVLTRREQSPRHALASYSIECGNPMLALASGLKGEGLVIVRREDFNESGIRNRSLEEVRQHVGWLTNRTIYRLAWLALRERVGRVWEGLRDWLVKIGNRFE